MNREIKFRFWGFFGEFDENEEPKNQMMYGDVFSFMSDEPIDDLFDGLHETIAMQYTGVTDKNDNKIYDGDIILYSGNEKIPKYTCTRLVEWHEGGFEVKYLYHTGNELPETSYLMSIYRHTIKHYYSVVGNIYENPDLIEGV